MPNLIILAGIPGCGKSTLAKHFFDLKYKIISSDEIRKKLFGGLKVAHEPEVKKANNARVFNTFHREIREALEHDIDVIADATNLNHFARENLRQIAEETNARLHLILFKNLYVATERNAARPEDSRVPEEAMAHMIGKFWDTLARLPQEKYVSITKVEQFA